jgi:hypothetical protein
MVPILWESCQLVEDSLSWGLAGKELVVGFLDL